MELEFRHLRIVIAVADEGSITRAAAALGLSQPSLTSQLQRIEKSLGAPLFERVRTGAVPTAFGRSVLAKARTVVSGMADLRGEPSPTTSGGRVELRLGGFPGPLLSVVTTRLADLYARQRGPDAPRPAVSVHTDPSAAAVLARVKAGRLDAAVVIDYLGFEIPEVEGVRRAVVVPREPQFVAIAEDHPLAAAETIDLVDLAGEDWLVDPQEDHGGVGPLRHACRAAGFEPRINHQISDASSAREFVSTGQCVSLAQPTSTEGRGLVVRPFTGDPILERVDLAWRDPCPIDPVLLHRAVREAYLAIVDRNTSYSRWWADRGALADPLA
ncbi:LysR family transcriptional regulator [Actinokineospora pegani]|uniref:LysR family transcriptional regulator n=1 Tax=Actinokineospora pegani TaxID=2654637 RepID=UPI0012E9CD94|nr:LysR family transcriptional regulator [Actinokineospora pegani]